MEQLVVDVGLHTEQLPDLPVLERDLQREARFLVGERFHFRIEDGHRRNTERLNEVHAVVDLLLAFPAIHHGRETSAIYIPNKCMV